MTYYTFPPPFYSSSTPPCYATTSATIPAPLPSHSFSHGFTPPSPSPYTPSASYSTTPPPSPNPYSYGYSSYYNHKQQPPLPYSQPQPPPYSPSPPYCHHPPYQPIDVIQRSFDEMLQISQRSVNEFTLSNFATEVSYLTGKITPPSFTHLDTTPLPWVSHSSCVEQPPLHNSTDLRHYNYDHHFEEPIYQPGLISLNNASAPQSFHSTEKEAEEEVKSHKLIIGSNFSTIPDEESLHIPANSFIPQTEKKSLAFLATTENGEEPTVKSQETILDGIIFSTIIHGNVFAITTSFSATATNEREEPPPILPSITQSIPQYFLPSCNSDSIASLSAISVCDSDLWFSGSKPCFDFIFLALDLICSSCSDFKLSAWQTTVSSPEKMAGNTISATPPTRSSFVFDPGGNSTTTVLPKRRNHCELQKIITRTVTVAAPPPPRSTFVFDPGGNWTIIVRRCKLLCAAQCLGG